MSNVETSNPKPSARLGRWQTAVAMPVWLSALYATLSLANVRSSWSGVLCGPWGCTAPLEAVISCHLSWMVVLWPIIWLTIRNHSVESRRWRVTGWGLLAFGIAGIASLTIQETFFSGIAFNSPYLLRRVGLKVVGFVEAPVIAAFIAGCACLACIWLPRRPELPKNGISPLPSNFF